MFLSLLQSALSYFTPKDVKARALLYVRTYRMKSVDISDRPINKAVNDSGVIYGSKETCPFEQQNAGVSRKNRTAEQCVHTGTGGRVQAFVGTRESRRYMLLTWQVPAGTGLIMPRRCVGVEDSTAHRAFNA